MGDQAEFVERSSCINCGSARIEEVSRGRYTDQPLRGFIDADPWGTNPLPYLKNAEWSFIQCTDCHQTFHARILTPEWNEKRFTEWMTAAAIEEFEKRLGNAATIHIQKGREHVTHVLRIEKLTRKIRNPGEVVRLLDFGSGWGEFLMLCQHFGFTVAGVDRSEARRGGARVPIYAGLDDLRGQKPFHAITLFEVLEHLDNPAATLRALVPLLAPGGLLILETPDCLGVTGIRSHSDYLKIHPLDHINAFTHQTLRSIAERIGFRCIARPATHATASLYQVIRTQAKHVLGRDGRSTQLYFVKD
jgi:2-polyprenyl-3-methyl-5-hydroxy-6-metoxy-1,4-benzoquinol methylase